MSPRPGVEVSVVDSAPPPSAPTDTGVLFLVGQTQSGPAVPTLTRSIKQYETLFGAREGFTDAYDAADVFFAEGGAKIYVQRWGAAGGLPASASAGLDLFVRTLGPGQVIAPGQTTPTTHAALLEHADTHNRIALLDAAKDEAAADLEPLVDPLRVNEVGRRGALFGDWAVVPGTVYGTQREVPFSAVAAGLMARSDRLGNPNIPAAGVNGMANYATDLVGAFTDSEYENLNEVGVNMPRLIYGAVRLYGYRTLVDPTEDENWVQLNNSRLVMALVAESEAVGENYVFAQIDGKRQKIAEFGAQLTGMLNDYYTAGALYGNEPADAYQVDVGPAVNTEETIALGELHAVLRVRMSPFAELVVIEIIKTPTTEVLPTAA